jgi:hypothetical protein
MESTKPVFKAAKERKKYVSDKAHRKMAFGLIQKNLDPLLVKLGNDADTIYGPKEILDPSDWLACHKEEGQPFEKWLNTPTRNKVNKIQSKIYLNIIDVSIGIDF